MPVINRIRIANINYDGRYIGDEIFDTYDGENVLLNLKNAGGKSVLVQLMLQPIIPGISIHGRKVESYLQQNKPSIIMLEWKLDNTPVPTYFLMAVVMRLSASDEKSSSRVNYFTFVNRYTEACEYDIANLPLISHDGGGISIMSYNECRNAVKNTAKPNSALNYFSSEDTAEYNAKQEQNGIFPDEWKLIARCNEEEGGISKMLENIKTSDNLFNEWILKTVAESISTGDTLMDMFCALIKSINENDENIRYKSILESFLNDNNGYVENLEKLMERYNTIEKLKTKIADIYHFLIASENQAAQAAEDRKSQMEYNREMIKQIHYEELSYEYHNAHEQYLCACDEYSEAAAEKEKARDILNGAKRYADLLRAADQYSELKKYKARENSAREELKQMRNGTDPDRYNDLVFSLRQCYSERIQDLQNENELLQQTYNNFVKNKADLRAESESKNNVIAELSSKIGGLKINIKNFKDYENKLLKELDVSPVHMLDDELDKDSVKDIRESFSDRAKELENELSETEKKISEAKSAILSLEEEKDGLNTLHTEISIKLSAEEREKKEYEEAEKKALDALKYFEIGESELFDREAVMSDIDSAERAKREKLDEYKLSHRRQEQYLEAVKAGTVHISSELSAELKNHNIDFTTGEEYLLNEPDERRTELLSKNPMLPFSYIVDERNLELIRKTELHGYADKAVPIITYENVGSMSAAAAKITEMSEKSLLLCLYNERCIDNESREKYIKELEERIDSTKKNITLLENEKRELKDRRDAYYSFNYARTFYAELDQRLFELNEKKNHIQKRNAEIPSELSAHNNTITKSEKTARDLNNRIAQNVGNAKRFDEYVGKYSDYLNDKRTMSDTAKAIDQNKARIGRIAEELTAVEDSIEEVSEKLRRTKYDLTVIREKLSRLDNTVIGKRLSLPVEQLEAEYRSMTDKVRSTREKLEREISEAVNNAGRCADRLKKLGIPVEEYSAPSLIFTDELLERAENAVKLNERHLSECDEKLSRCGAEKSRLSGVADTRKQDLKKAGYGEALERALIKLEFDERRSRLLEKNSALKKEIEEYKDLHDKCALKAAELKDHYVDGLYSGKYIPANVSEIDTDALKRSLNEQLSARALLERGLKSSYEEVRRKYTSYGYEAIDAFIKNMNFEEQKTFDGYFEVFDHIKECQKCLEEELELIKSDLEQLENKKTNFIRHALEHAQKIYNEVKNISNLSRIKIDGKPRRMIVIGVPENADSRCEENMRAYLDKFLADIRASNAEEPITQQKLLRKIENAFSDRELLNIVIGQRQIDVSLYKVDITGNNGGIRRWEDVCVENSGAQKFISAFAFVSTLIEYARGKRMEKMGAENMSGKKAFILDNPFGATSSEKFLDVMQALSQKFDIQLICLSDLRQSSITNKFSVFYQLALRNSLYSNRASLKISDVKTNGDIHKNVKLEHAVAKFGQITLF